MQAVVDVNAAGNDVPALLPGERAQLGKRVAGIVRPRQDRTADRYHLDGGHSGEVAVVDPGRRRHAFGGEQRPPTRRIRFVGYPTRDEPCHESLGVPGRLELADEDALAAVVARERLPHRDRGHGRRGGSGRPGSRAAVTRGGGGPPVPLGPPGVQDVVGGPRRYGSILERAALDPLVRGDRYEVDARSAVALVVYTPEQAGRGHIRSHAHREPARERAVRDDSCEPLPPIDAQAQVCADVGEQRDIPTTARRQRRELLGKSSQDPIVDEQVGPPPLAIGRENRGGGLPRRVRVDRHPDLADPPPKRRPHSRVHQRAVRGDVQRQRRRRVQFRDQVSETTKRERLAAAERDLEGSRGREAREERGRGRHRPQAAARGIPRAEPAPQVAGVGDPEHCHAWCRAAESRGVGCGDADVRPGRRMEEKQGPVEWEGVERVAGHTLSYVVAGRGERKSWVVLAVDSGRPTTEATSAIATAPNPSIPLQARDNRPRLRR